MFHLIGTVFFTYNAHITLHALLPDSTSQTGLLFAGFSLVFLNHFWSCQVAFLLEEKSFMAFLFSKRNLIATQSVLSGRRSIFTKLAAFPVQ